MPWVTVDYNPNSQASLYGNTRNMGASAADRWIRAPKFWQNPDGTFPAGSPALEREPSHLDDNSGTVQGEPIYDIKTAKPLENPPNWNNIKNNPAIGGRDYKDVANIESDPALQQLVNGAITGFYDQYGAKGGSLLGGFVKDVGPFFAGTIGAGSLLAALGGAAGAVGAAGGSAGGLTGNALGLAQMGQAAGLSGSALDSFIASGGVLGSTAAGGGGIGFGAAGGQTPATAQLPSFTGPQTTNVPLGADIGIGNLPSTPSIPGGSGGQTPATAQLPAISGPQTTNAPAFGNPADAASGAAQTALQRVLNGTATAADYASLLGTVGATGLSVLNSSRQADQQQALADQLMGFGAPSRARYEASFAPGFTMATEPGYADALKSTSDTLLRRLSATGGNPYGNPGSLIEANKAIDSSLALPALQNYRNQNASSGGYGAFNTQAAPAASAAIGSSGNALTNLAGGISDILNPRPQQLSLSDILRQINSGGVLA